MSDEQPPTVTPNLEGAAVPPVPAPPALPEAPESAGAEAAPPAEIPSDPPAPAVVEEPPSKKKWYVVKVQSNREDTIKDAIERRVKIEGLEEFFGQIKIPVERVTEMSKTGKRVTRERKLLPGYLMAEVEYNDRILYLFRETSGVGDFVGGSLVQHPPPMSAKEVSRFLGAEKPAGDTKEGMPEKPPFEVGERVRVRDGAFAGMEGDVKDVLGGKGQVRIELTLWGRPVTHELEYWQVEPV